MGRKVKPADNLPESTRRLLEVVESLGINRSEFAKKVGMSASGFNSLFLKGIKINPTLAKAAELEFKISQQWLLDGIGDRKVERSHELSEYQKLCLRLVPRHDPDLTWKCFESLQSFPSASINTVNIESSEDFGKAALLIRDETDDKQWWSKYRAKELDYELLRQKVKEAYIELANETVIGGYDQTLLFKILLDGLILTDEMLDPQKFVCATELVSDETISEYLERVRRFAQLRQKLGNFWKLPLKLKKLYVRCHNDKQDFEETTALDECRQGRILVSLEGWLKLDNQQQIMADRKRKDIFQQRLRMARLEGQKDSRKSLEEVNEKLAQLQYQLDTLLEEWGGDGTEQ